MSKSDKTKQRNISKIHNLQSSLIESLPYPSMLVRKDRTVIFTNRVAREIGATVGGQCWRDFGQSEYIPDQDKAYINEHKEKPPGGTHCTFCLADNALNDLKTTIATDISFLGGTWDICWIPINKDVYLHYAIDITERKLAEQERQALLNDLSEKTNEMENLLRIVTHDLRAPLVNIQGFGNVLKADCQLLKQTIGKINLDEKIKDTTSTLIDKDIPESLNFISTSVKKINALIEGLNMLVKVGKVELNIETLDINDLARQITETVYFQADELGASINIEPLPDCKGDENQLNQVFSNLIINSLKYFNPKRKGKITITGQLKGDRSIYCVKDNGIGIPKDHIDKIFNLFHQVDGKSKVGGEGVGLAIVKQILNRNSGSIWVESEQGKGSKFFVSLPTA